MVSVFDMAPYDRRAINLKHLVQYPRRPARKMFANLWCPKGMPESIGVISATSRFSQTSVERDRTTEISGAGRAPGAVYAACGSGVPCETLCR